MMLDKVFAPFVKEKPICVMARAVLQRILEPQFIDQLFARTAQRQYTHELLFSTLVDLLSRVVLKQEPSVYAAYRTLEQQIPVSDQSIYNKLQHVELSVSAALVHDAAPGTRLSRPVSRWQSSRRHRASLDRVTLHLGSTLARHRVGRARSRTADGQRRVVDRR